MAHKVEAKLEITKSSSNIFADIGLKNADKYLAKAELARQINHIIEKRAFKQKEAIKVLGIDQPKISDLSCGRLDGFSIEQLIDFLNKLDRDVTIIVKKTPTRRKEHARHRTKKSELDELKHAAHQLEKLLKSHGITENELLTEFRTLRKGQGK